MNLQSLSQEVLTWVHLKHIYILPFLGLDEKIFEGYPPCIITPYMRNGTMSNFVKNRMGTLPDKRVDQLIYTGEQPFPSIREDITVVLEILKEVHPSRPSGSPDGPRAMSDGLWATVKACWAHKPSDRHDMDKVSELIKASS
ncbi:Kinase-like protein [Mycena venus]|uniref:Kinase-like protein n=1 Tax=Mycena venus TaxID=2733690 RepID=A0A8H6YFH8_9AGAR|nr:Kinase-like protein [Mycena venus]